MCFSWIARAAALALLTASAGQAQAARIDLALTGTVADAYTSAQTIANTHFDRWFLSLGGLDAGSAFSVSQGDSIIATITFDQSLTIPASVNFTTLVMSFQGTGFAGTVGTHGSFELLNLGAPVRSIYAGSGTVNQLAVGVGIGPPGNATMSFDSMVASFTIDALSQPAQLNSAMLSYMLFSPAVPEPTTHALMLLGMAALGGLACQRTRLTPPSTVSVVPTT